MVKPISYKRGEIGDFRLLTEKDSELIQFYEKACRNSIETRQLDFRLLDEMFKFMKVMSSRDLDCSSSTVLFYISFTLNFFKLYSPDSDKFCHIEKRLKKIESARYTISQKCDTDSSDPDFTSTASSDEGESNEEHDRVSLLQLTAPSNSFVMFKNITKVKESMSGNINNLTLRV